MMVLVTGGSASGKSSYAESLCCALPEPRYYIATMKPEGAEGARRIAHHRKLREGKGFETIECPADLARLELPAKGCALVEDIGNLVANEMFDDTGTVSDPTEHVLEGISALQDQCDALIVVTNEVGCGGQTYGEGIEAYIRVVGHVNAMLASAADVVVEVVCGIPITLKGELPFRVEMPAPSGEA